MNRWTLPIILLCGSALHAASSPVSLEEAIRLLGAGQSDEAARALEALASANPYDGMTAYYFGVALQRSGHCERALESFDAALALGANGERNGMRSANLRAAECLATLGRIEESVARVQEAWSRWGADDVPRLTSGDVYGPLRERQLLVPLSGRTAAADAGGPVERMRADLAYFDRLVRETHPDPFHHVSEAAWRAAVDSLASRLPALAAPSFNLELMRLGAMVGDGHTSVFPTTQGDHAWRLLPFFLLRVADGWVIAAAAQAQRELVGGRIDAVGGRSIDEVYAVIDAFVSGDNDVTARWLGGVAMQCFESYSGLGLANDDGSVTFRVTLASGEQQDVRLPAGPIDRDPNARWAPDDWPDIGSGTLWLADPGKPFSTHWLETERVLYVQLNQLRDSETQTVAEFGEAVLAELRRTQAAGLVLDLRHDNGGSTELSYPFLRSIARYEPLDREGSLVALIGPRSYSATMDLAGRLQLDLGARFVGWPTGGRPNTYSTERPFRLPYSGISGTISARWHQEGISGDDHRPWIAPEVAVWPTIADIASGRDPVLAAALRLIGSAEPGSGR